MASTIGGLVLGALFAVPLSASAHGQTIRSAGQAKSPFGTYTIISSNGGTGDITVLDGYTFTSDYGDSGIWDYLAKSVVFLVTSS